jgi:hypothetical protein
LVGLYLLSSLGKLAIVGGVKGRFKLVCFHHPSSFHTVVLLTPIYQGNVFGIRVNSMIFARVTARIASTFDVPTEAHKSVCTILGNSDIAVLQ